MLMVPTVSSFFPEATVFARMRQSSRALWQKYSLVLWAKVILGSLGQSHFELFGPKWFRALWTKVIQTSLGETDFQLRGSTWFQTLWAVVISNFFGPRWFRNLEATVISNSFGHSDFELFWAKWFRTLWLNSLGQSNPELVWVFFVAVCFFMCCLLSRWNYCLRVVNFSAFLTMSYLIVLGKTEHKWLLIPDAGQV